MEAFVGAAEEDGYEVAADDGIDIDAIKGSYRELMGIYNRALAQASRLGRTLKDEAEVEGFKDSDAGGSMVRLMVGTHIRHRLHELAVGYGQLLPTAEGSAREWLEQAIEDCRTIVESLPRIRLRPLLLAVVAPLAAALSKLPGLPDWLGVAMISLAGAIPGLLLAGFVTVRGSYRFKRALLFPKAAEVDELPIAEQKTRVGDNAYKAENEAFGAIGRGKRLEREIDRMLIALALLLAAEGLTFATLAVSSKPYWWVPLAGAVVLFAAYFLVLFRSKERFWR